MDLDKQQIIDLLAELGDEMQGRGQRAEMFIVGGAAMALAFDARRATRDIDAVFVPKAAVYEAAQAVAGRHGLAPDWLNDAVKGFLLGEDPDRRTIFESPGLSVTVPSPQYLLAMKVYAARVDRDADDIRILADLCDLHIRRGRPGPGGGLLGGDSHPGQGPVPDRGVVPSPTGRPGRHPG